MTQTVILDLSPSGQARKTLSVECVEAVEPLDAQFGQMEKRCVPESLLDHVFQPDMTTYAVYDAAAVTGLTGMLANAGLPHSCLFQGDTEDELGDVAPWIVQLDPENDFTRKVFTKGSAPWDLWRKPNVLLIQSSASIDELRAHLRKFTRAQDVEGRWLFFRFWEVSVLRFLRKNSLHDDLSADLLDTHRFLFPDRGPDGRDCLWMLRIEDSS